MIKVKALPKKERVRIYKLLALKYQDRTARHGVCVSIEDIDNKQIKRLKDRPDYEYQRVLLPEWNLFMSHYFCAVDSHMDSSYDDNEYFDSRLTALLFCAEMASQ